MSAQHNPPGPPVVRTRYGYLAGTVVAVSGGDGGDGGRAVHAFLAVPYAAPPIGPLRWRLPQPPVGWSGMRMATAFGADCPQAAAPFSRASGTSEDCLYLNIWTPADAAPASLPVLVWFHGGSFVVGSGADARCDGARMAALGAVVVTVNYRLGVFGFLAHPALSRESGDGVSGNYGLHDQLCALGWIRDNITGFGGDPARVTVAGVSAGGSSIVLLMTSPHARGLFQRAILQSPGSARPLAGLAEAEAGGEKLGADIEGLRRLAPADLLAAQSALAPAMRSLTAPRLLRPIRDGCLLGEDDRDAMKAGRLHAVDVLVGGNADEGTVLTAGWPIDTLARYRELLAANFVGAADRFEQAYPAATDREAKLRTAQMFADTQFNYGVRLLARAMADSGARTWRYLFTRRVPGQHDGPHHEAEIAYVFGNLRLGANGRDGAQPHDRDDEAVSSAMMRAWLAFASHGDPNHPGLPAWPRFETTSDFHLELGTEVRIGSGRRNAELDIIDQFHEQTRQGRRAS